MNELLRNVKTLKIISEKDNFSNDVPITEKQKYCVHKSWNIFKGNLGASM